jgi:microcystin-dependent protein
MTTKVSLIADNAVTGAAINNLTITADDIKDNAVTAAKLATGVAIPIGVIVMWYGSSTTSAVTIGGINYPGIPTGWALCDGSTVNQLKTPDLRERFIVGAGGDNSTVAGTSGYTPGNTGGGNTVILGTTNIPAHNHGVSNFSNPGNHYHGPSSEGGFDNEGNGQPLRALYEDGPPFNGIVWDLGGGGHTHSFDINNAFGNAQGGTDAHENRPPYYALAFIMKFHKSLQVPLVTLAH